ncbi:MAG: UDP-N-acetylmuramoyl-tripeptide--D-alanyl-D-alanine ligase [Chloroflexaceae bacterium]|nr:UDP-N-acetylmuramoyl-tripeptide--D-alanyl-D-alanine ligase [Chloroflexaceae bacterium]
MNLAHVICGVYPALAHQEAACAPAWQHLTVTEVVADSREVGPGALFVALAGERTDGHRFLADAAARGARGALVSAEALTPHRAILESLPPPWVVVHGPAPDGSGLPIACPDDGEQDDGERHQGTPTTPPFLSSAGAPGFGFVLIAVDDPLKALHRLTRYHRATVTPTVVGITGSVGKTSTKEAVATVLGCQYRTLKSQRSFNSEVTVPTTLLQLRPSHQAAVIEMGMWAPGEIRLLASLARPHLGIVTNVGPSHLERLGSIEAIAQAKAELVEALPPDGVAILNADDARVAAMAGHTRARVLTYGITAPHADVRAGEIETNGLHGVSFRVYFRGSGSHDAVASFKVPLVGRHSVYTALAAIATGLAMGMPWEKIAAGLGSLDLSSQVRLRVLPGSARAGACTILDDTYNASPMSSLAALDVLAECGSADQRMVILGDMLELGGYEEEGHRMVGRRVAEVAHRLVGVGIGPRVRWIAEEARRWGMDAHRVVVVECHEQAIPIVRELVRDGDYVLVKGSRGAAMEHIVAALVASTSPAIGDTQPGAP